ncbi:DUF2339 domain-containing protein [Ruminiclostridium herbifermentans]|uniref:DUF2339 domain-containing protein n=1 Tax=Ruminiclostridium herbifermentans TaxID=2488810 RepID=A0A4V6EPD1_9FIRM|nr:DUF2339 domain-containing protein [Ruminiclostridium herbifermentans]QNU68145.1 DUF2339 domain-containing protein [Ruminiclostridium herbifermentans]
MVDNLKDILARQKETLTELQNEISRIEASDLVTENKSLKTELLQCQDSLKKEKDYNLKLSEENKNLRNAIYEQLYNEKIQILNSTNKKLEAYYSSNIQGELNRLIRYENSVKKRIDEMAGILRQNRVDISDDIYKRLEELQKLLNAKVTAAREELQRNAKTFEEARFAEFEKLRNEQVTEHEIKERVKQNNIESFIGLNIINKLGILLLIIGVITASQFTYFKLPDVLKCVFAFLIGGLLLVAGEILNRKKPNVFSLGITSGGIAILYVALALSFFRFEVIEKYPALGLCVLITAGAFVLSQRYNSQTISAFAMVGGYLPIFSITGSKSMIYGAMIYFVILNVLALSISINKKWSITAYIGFWLNVFGSFYITIIMMEERSYRGPVLIDDLMTILYITFAFAIYTLIPVVGTLKKKLAFKTSDIVLLALNTIISAVLLYLVFYAVNLSDYTGVLAVAFAAVYMALGRFVEKLMPNEKKARALFFITGLTFVVLIIPFQFGRVWLSLGWLVEGVAILSYGIYKEIKAFKRTGAIVSLLCLLAFVIFDLTNISSSLFVYKYLAITIGSIAVMGALIYKKDLIGKQIKLFKYAVTLNIWFFAIYIIEAKLNKLLSEFLVRSGFDIDYLITAAVVLVSFVLAYIIPKIKVLLDRVMKVLSVIIYVVGLIILFALNFNSPVIGYLNEVPLTISIIGTIELAVIALLSIFVVKDLVLTLVTEKRLGIEWYPLIISFYFVVILTQNLITQFRLEMNNAAISIIYLITALAWITFGFLKRYVLIRRFGLGMCILAVAKLFIIDLSFLSQGYRIVSYFVFGVTLIAISFVYQYFNKKIDTISGVISDDKKDNS